MRSRKRGFFKIEFSASVVNACATSISSINFHSTEFEHLGLPSIDVATQVQIYGKREYRSVEELRKMWGKITLITSADDASSGRFLVYKSGGYLKKGMKLRNCIQSPDDLSKGLRKLFDMPNASFEDILHENQIQITARKADLACPDSLLAGRTCYLGDQDKNDIVRMFYFYTYNDTQRAINIPGTISVLEKPDNGTDWQFHLNLVLDEEFNLKSSPAHSLKKVVVEQVDRMEEFLKDLPLKRSDGDPPVVCYLDGSMPINVKMRIKNCWYDSGKLAFDWEVNGMIGIGFEEESLIYRDANFGEGRRREIYEVHYIEGSLKKANKKFVRSILEENQDAVLKFQNIGNYKFGEVVGVEKGENFSTIEYEAGEMFVGRNSSFQCLGRFKSEPNIIYAMNGLIGNDVLPTLATPKQPTEEQQTKEQPTEEQQTKEQPTEEDIGAMDGIIGNDVLKESPPTSYLLSESPKIGPLPKSPKIGPLPKSQKIGPLPKSYKMDKQPIKRTEHSKIGSKETPVKQVKVNKIAVPDRRKSGDVKVEESKSEETTKSEHMKRKVKTKLSSVDPEHTAPDSNAPSSRNYALVSVVGVVAVTSLYLFSAYLPAQNSTRKRATSRKSGHRTRAAAS